MINLIDGILTTLILIPGFVCVYLPYKIFAIKMRFSNLELTLFSLVISIIIFTLTFITYQIFNSIAPSFFIDLSEISKITVIQLIENKLFMGIFLIYIIIFIFIGIFFVSKDRLRNFRKKISGWKTIIRPEEYVWTLALHDHAKNTQGYGIVETNNDELFLGQIKQWTRDLDEKELLLKYPEKYDPEQNRYVHINNLDSILFLHKDIRRIYLITSIQTDTESNSNNSVKKSFLDGSKPNS
jgi:hypothetical protein